MVVAVGLPGDFESDNVVAAVAAFPSAAFVVVVESFLYVASLADPVAAAFPVLAERSEPFRRTRLQFEDAPAILKT